MSLADSVGAGAAIACGLCGLIFLARGIREVLFLTVHNFHPEVHICGSPAVPENSQNLGSGT